MAADDNDDPGVLGNLPRSRPGARSAKRATGGRKGSNAGQARASSGARATASAQQAKRARPASASARRTVGGRPTASTTASSPGGGPQRRGGGPGDPITQAVRLAGKVAETGVKTSVGILRRLTRL